MAVQSMLEGTKGVDGVEGMLYLPVLRCSAVEIALSSRVLEVFEDVLCVRELLEGMRRVGRGNLCTICCGYGR